LTYTAEQCKREYRPHRRLDAPRHARPTFLLAEVHNEILTSVSRSSNSVKLDMPTLLSNPLLQSIYSEELRLINRSLRIGNYVFQKDKVILVSAWHEKRDRSVWNEGPVNGNFIPLRTSELRDSLYIRRTLRQDLESQIHHLHLLRQLQARMKRRVTGHITRRSPSRIVYPIWRRTEDLQGEVLREARSVRKYGVVLDDV
jgi:hypothetical protein